MIYSNINIAMDVHDPEIITVSTKSVLLDTGTYVTDFKIGIEGASGYIYLNLYGNGTQRIKNMETLMRAIKSAIDDITSQGMAVTPKGGALNASHL